ncbi:hypothetical protein ES702_06167 [subsurface metagenome]
MIILELKKRNRDYGLITWPHALDFDVKTLFDQSEKLNFEFGNKILTRKISYQHRRFSIGKKRLESLKKISLSRKGKLISIQPVD